MFLITRTFLEAGTHTLWTIQAHQMSSSFQIYCHYTKPVVPNLFSLTLPNTSHTSDELMNPFTEPVTFQLCSFHLILCMLMLHKELNKDYILFFYLFIQYFGGIAPPVYTLLQAKCFTCLPILLSNYYYCMSTDSVSFVGILILLATTYFKLSITITIICR